MDVDTYSVTDTLMCFLKIELYKATINIAKNNLSITNSFVKHNLDMYVAFQLGKLFSYTWTMGEFSCKLLYYLQGVSGICSALNLTSLSIERYVRCIFLHL